MYKRQKGNIFKEEKNVQKSNRFLKIKTGGPKADGPTSIPADNRAGSSNADNVKWDAGKRTKTYTFGQNSGVYAEAKAPTLTKRPEQKEPSFQQDKEKQKLKKRGDRTVSPARVGRPDGLGQEYDTRAGGQGAAAGAGLGNQTYSETIEFSNASQNGTAMLGAKLEPNPLSEKKPFKKFRTNIKEYSGFQNDTESGLGGVLGGASNKEGMDSYKDTSRNIQNDYGLKIKKKKKQEK